MSSSLNPREILNEIAQIQRMVRGKICVLRQGANGPYHNCQCWENGKNHSRYVPADKLANYQEAIEGYHRFAQLTEQYAQHIITRTHAELASGTKKRRCPGANHPRPRPRNSAADRPVRSAGVDRGGGARV